MIDVAVGKAIPSPLEVGAADIPDRVATTIVALLRNELFFTRSPCDQERPDMSPITVYTKPACA